MINNGEDVWLPNEETIAQWHESWCLTKIPLISLFFAWSSEGIYDRISSIKQSDQWTNTEPPNHSIRPAPHQSPPTVDRLPFAPSPHPKP